MSHATCPLIQTLSRTVWSLVFRVLVGPDLAADGAWIASDSQTQFLETRRVPAN